MLILSVLFHESQLAILSRELSSGVVYLFPLLTLLGVTVSYHYYWSYTLDDFFER